MTNTSSDCFDLERAIRNVLTSQKKAFNSRTSRRFWPMPASLLVPLIF